MRSILLPALLISSFCSLGSASCNKSFREDTSPIPAIEAGDETIVMRGFGQKAAQGLLHVRVYEDSAPEGLITVVLPKLNCKLDSCAEFKAIRDGNKYPIGAFKKDDTEYRFPLSQLIQDETKVLASHQGAYRLLLRYFYENDEGEQQRVISGRVYLTILKGQYTPLVCNSPDVVVSENIFEGCNVQFTTKGRTALCGNCGE